MKIFDYDLFRKEVPRFHVEGRQNIGTGLGCCLSVLLVTLLAVFTGFRSVVLVSGARPNISSFTVKDERKGNQLVDLDQKQFKVAFSVQKLDGDNKNPINDPDFVEWYAFFAEDEKEKRHYTLVMTHKCTEEDYSEFHDILDS